MSASVRDESVAGFASVVLENSRLRAVLIPALGGRVWELFDKRHNRQWIWHRTGVPLVACSPGSLYDDVWAGGWEELFPNDSPGTFEGRVLADHGEWWTSGWCVVDVKEGTEAVVRLVAESHIRGACCIKEYRLNAQSATLRVRYYVQNLVPKSFHFLFKQHLPIAITPTCRLVLPGGLVSAVDPSFGTMLPGPGPFAWPKAGRVDLRKVPIPSHSTREFVYVNNMPEGWCGVDDWGSRATLRMHFDTRQLPFLWLFLTYGGWRGCYTAVLEPCTNMPKDLHEAVRLGQSACLAGDGLFETEITVTLGTLTPNAPEGGASRMEDTSSANIPQDRA